MQAFVDSLTWATFVVLAAALFVIGGGVHAIRQTVRQPTYETAIAYGAGGLFATLFLLAVGQAAYVLGMWTANLEIAAAPVALRPEMLQQAELEARSSLYVAVAGAAVALPMAVYLFVRALRLRGHARERAPERERPYDRWQPHGRRDADAH